MSGIIGGIISGLGNYFGAQAAADGAKEAARIQAKFGLQAIDKQAGYAKEARDETRAAAGRGLGYIDAGLSGYQNTINPLMTARPILLPSHRGMTTQQQLGLEDLRRGTGAALAASGQRGAGRGGIAAGLDAERRYIASARAGNDTDALSEQRRAQGVADIARSGVANAQLGVGGAKAGVETGAGNTIANSLSHTGDVAATITQNIGQARGNAANQIGQYNAGAILGTTNVAGQGIGQILGGGAAVDQGDWNV